MQMQTKLMLRAKTDGKRRLEVRQTLSLLSMQTRWLSPPVPRKECDARRGVGDRFLKIGEQIRQVLQLKNG